MSFAKVDLYFALPVERTGIQHKLLWIVAQATCRSHHNSKGLAATAPVLSRAPTRSGDRTDFVPRVLNRFGGEATPASEEKSMCWQRWVDLMTQTRRLQLHHLFSFLGKDGSLDEDWLEAHQRDLGQVMEGEQFEAPDMMFFEEEEKKHHEENRFCVDMAPASSKRSLDLSCFSGIHGVTEITVRPKQHPLGDSQLKLNLKLLSSLLFST
ncbi:hypothetical protein GWK47_048253 [Chionoecetes opilio]|uniref:Uncharacterized protein n=1 Tax=Chionoecetes opilio TaxID=41210 RepID=A0A8J4Y4S6_CHIOP|nr:hypothetical protein GWK47_048253 [Chionoecetes opilio]